ERAGATPSAGTGTLRRRADGRANADDGRLGGHAPHPPTVARGATPARHRGDRQRHAGGARGLAGRGDGGLPRQAGRSGAGAQAPPEREPHGQPTVAGVLDPLALERLVETIGDDRNLLTALIDTFVSDAPRLVEAARRGLEHGQTDEVRRAAHTLKANGATFGATSLSELSRQLEALARARSPEGARELIARMDVEAERVRIALATVREGPPCPAGSGFGPVVDDPLAN